MFSELDLRTLWKELDDYDAELEKETKTLSDVWLKIAQLKSKNDQELKEIHEKEEFDFVHPETDISINVGGQYFETKAGVLIADPYSLLAALCRTKPIIQPNEHNVFYIDRDWWLFRHILAFLRSGKLPKELETLKELYKESSYYRLESLRKSIEDIPVDSITYSNPHVAIAMSGVNNVDATWGQPLGRSVLSRNTF